MQEVKLEDESLQELLAELQEANERLTLSRLELSVACKDITQLSRRHARAALLAKGAKGSRRR